MIGYQYDANGNRIGKGTVTNWHICDITANGYIPTTDFVLDQSGGQMTEMAVYTTNAGTQYQHVHSNVAAGGALIASFDSLYNPHFYLTDALGSRRVQTDLAGIPEQTCQSLPFGDQMLCTGGSLSTPTEHHFTGKERDAESGLDDFGARYYASSMGRFMSPDPLMASAHPENPQSWNRYTYALNNPLSLKDVDGLYPSPAFNCDKDHSACLNDDQRRILNNSSIKVGDKTLSGEALWNAIGGEKNGEALQNSFVNRTDGLSAITFADGKSAISFVNSITGIKQDRIIANVGGGLADELSHDSRFNTAPGGLHGDYGVLSYKSNDYPHGNIQFSFNASHLGADIDHDLFKPGLGHFFGEVAPNMTTGGLTNQDSVRRMLIKNPNIGLTPSPDPNWNRK